MPTSKRVHRTIYRTLASAFLAAAAIAAVAEEPAREDFLTFARGAIPLAVGGETTGAGIGIEAAIAAIDGNRGKYGLGTKPVNPEATTEFLYELPAATTFDRFAVPSVEETPSPSQTFVKRVEVQGSNEGPDTGFQRLADIRLQAHGGRGEVTELNLHASTPVRWIKVRLSGGLDVQGDKIFRDFSEIIGNGVQEPVPLAKHFDGIWKYRANLLELKQEGARVTGCYDGPGELHGTVDGNVLRATGVSLNDGVPSSFILTITPDGEVRGVRSSNNGPFNNYALQVAPKGTVTDCSKIEVAQIGCGSTVHGIQFAFDSADIRPESGPLLADLFAGLQSSPGMKIVIEGHTSSEGSEEYNQKLSERRARAVVDDLVTRGIDRNRIRAAGKGESEPIAGNVDEAGRSLNRRVEVECAEMKAAG